MNFDDAIATCPIVAILRGLTPESAIEVVDILFDAGIRAVEVPLNSPEPIKSIEAIARKFGGSMLVGAGTVLTSEHVAQIADVGGRLIVSPNVDPSVIQEAVTRGLFCAPGFATATEAFLALKNGAQALKLFPAATYGLAHIQALSAVLPSKTKILAVGGVTASTMAPWLDAGVAGFGLGSELFKPGFSEAEIASRARACVEAARVAVDR